MFKNAQEENKIDLKLKKSELIDKKKEAKAELENLYSLIEQAKKDIKTFGDYSEKIKKAEELCIKKEKETRDRILELNEAEKAISSFDGILNDKQREFENLKLTLQNESIKVQEEYQDKLSKVKSIELEVSKLKELKDKAEKELADTLNADNKVLSQVKKTTEEILKEKSKIEKEIQKSNTELESLNKKISDKNNEINKLTVETSGLNSEYTQIKKELESIDPKIEKKRKELEEVIKNIEERKEWLAEEEGALSDKENFLKRKEDELRNVKLELENFYGRKLKNINI
jgi:chromosome segregation protein